jgi:hypothetical protein
MQDTLKGSVFFKDFRNCNTICNITANQRCALGEKFVACTQIVDHDCRVSGSVQLAQCVRADVSGSTRDK